MKKELNLDDLRKRFDAMPEDKRILANKTLDRAIFLSKVLDELEGHIGKNGSVEYFKQGVQEMWRESPALKSYNNTIKNYNNTITTIFNLLPNGESEPKDEMFEFMKQGSELRAKK